MTRHELDNVTVPVIIQSVGADLRLRGRPGERLLVDGDTANVNQLGAGQPVAVIAGGDARVTVPQAVDVSVQAVGGDAKLTDISGAVDVQHVGGDVVVRNVDHATIKAVGGDLVLKRVNGPVAVEAVGGDATIRDVQGDVKVGAVGGDLYLRRIDGACLVDQVGADLVLSIHFEPGRSYRFNVGDSILCRVSADEHATFLLPPGTDVASEVDAQVIDTDEAVLVKLGDGTAQVQVAGASRLRLVSAEDDTMATFGMQLEDEMVARLSTLEQRLNEQLEGLDERLQESTVRFASQAERMASLAQERAARAVDQAWRSLERLSKPKAKRSRKGPFGPDFSAPQPPPHARAPPHEPVREQERLLILQMVQDGKISIEEAEKLLAALDR